MISSVCRARPSLQTPSSTALLLQFEKYFSSTFVKSPVSCKKRHNSEQLVPYTALVGISCLGSMGLSSWITADIGGELC